MANQIASLGIMVKDFNKIPEINALLHAYSDNILSRSGMPYIEELLKQNLISERCAIARYEKICEMTFGKDYETHRLASKILHEELEHEQEITDFQDDIAAEKQNMHHAK